MVRTIAAHFDGRVIVPDEPLDLPADTPLSVTLEPADGGADLTIARAESHPLPTGWLRGWEVPDEAWAPLPDEIVDGFEGHP